MAVTPLTQLFVDLVRVETRLYNLVEDRIRTAHGMSLGQYQVMQILERHGTCRVQDLAREVDITVGAMSKSVDRVEAAGWCRRSANPDDRRSSLVDLTEDGRRALAAATPTFTGELSALLDGAVSEQALRDVADALAVLRRTLERRPGRA